MLVGQAVLACPSIMLEYRRRLPHFQPDHVHIFLTWRLFGSLPAIRAKGSYPTPGHAFVAADRALDHPGSGPQWLRDPRIAGLVAESIRSGASRRRWYELDAWVVMPNHVHVLVELWTMSLGRLLKAWKGASAHAVNLVLGSGGTLWQREYWDRYIRDEAHFGKARHYIESNPVKAGLSRAAAEWPFSSANPKWRWTDDGGSCTRYSGARLIHEDRRVPQGARMVASACGAAGSGGCDHPPRGLTLLC